MLKVLGSHLQRFGPALRPLPGEVVEVRPTDATDAAVPGATHKGGAATGSNAAATVFSRKAAVTASTTTSRGAESKGIGRPEPWQAADGGQAAGRGRVRRRGRREDAAGHVGPRSSQYCCSNKITRRPAFCASALPELRPYRAPRSTHIPGRRRPRHKPRRAGGAPLEAVARDGGNPRRGRGALMREARRP